MTPLQSNALLSLLALLLMFGVVSVLLWQVIKNFDVLGCAGTEVIVGLLGLMISCVGGTVWVVKKFADSNGYVKEII